MKFNGNTAWYIPNMNNNRSSSYPITKLWDQDFTYCFRFKVDWETMVVPRRKEMLETNEWKVGGIVVRNGAHFGMNTVVGIDETGEMLKALEATIWITNSENPVNPSIEDMDYMDNSKTECLSIKIDSKTSKTYHPDKGEKDGMTDTINWDGWINCVFVSEYNKRLILYVDDFKDTLYYDGTLLDYSLSWLWVGCCNGFSGIDMDNDYFTGEISHLGLFQKCLTKDERKLFFENLNDLSVLNNYNMNPVAMTDFKKKTPYKIYDLSENGNHLTVYKEKSMEPMYDIQNEVQDQTSNRPTE